ncbi:MAG: SNF2 helicase associated domain-containing protein [Verrucomicrobia bacterium]|nr:SNF2 helicase associated domain-containing protein [Verrucomicrobiota bacterium]
MTEKLLVDAGGWDVLKHARALREMGRVISANYAPPLLRGFVREGETEYRAGLKIDGPTRIENICSCRQSREYGTICAHSVAVGLAVVAAKAPPPAPAKPAPAQPATPARVTHDYYVDDASLARIHVVLPPNFAAAWAKGGIMFGLELQRGPQRTLLPKGQRTGLTRGDWEVVEALAQLGGTAPGGMSMLTGDQCGRMLDALRGHPRVSLARKDAVTVRDAALRPGLQVTRRPAGGAELALELPPDAELLVAQPHPWLWQPKTRTLTPFGVGVPAAYAAIFAERRIVLGAAEAAALLTRELPTLQEHFLLSGVDAGAAEPAGAGPKAGFAVRAADAIISLEIEGSLQHLDGVLQAHYPEGRNATIGLTPESEVFTWTDPERVQLLWSRNVPAERAAAARLAKLGFVGPGSGGRFALKGQEAILTFFALGLPALQREWKVRIGARFQRVTEAQVEVIKPEVEIRGSGENWFDLEYSLVSASSRERISGSDIQRLLQMGRGHTKLKNGRIGIVPAGALDDLQQVLLDCDPGQPQAGVYRIGRRHAAYLDGTLQQLGAAETPAWQKFRRGEKTLATPSEVPLTPEIAAVARPYQREGIAWLALLARNSLGGILADEMGLGKTLQTLGWLAAGAKEEGGKKKEEGRPALVVCPTSLLENWRREAAKFAPQLRVVTLHGLERAQRFAAARQADLVLTSYALLRRDAEFHASLRYRAAVLDEAHAIKNPDSQTARAAFGLQAEHRLVLTGTPLENSVRDLWSLMNFALPGYLGKREEFRDRYELPISRESDPGARDRLARRLRPVLLRRRKRDVVKDLPEKLEQVAWCELTPRQAAAYREILEQGRKKIDEAEDERSGRMLILSTLLRLRQACCDLRLLGLAPADDAEADDEEPVNAEVHSAKAVLLAELLEEIREGGHRVLIFSQFVSMLTLLREQLEARGVEYCYLDGATKERQREVDTFQTDDRKLAFLISLKAGGTGLNLTAADTVIHFDPWWNPAVEAQATDRAHRIGQNRVVTSYQLITRGTVEEKILNLQRRKRETTAAVLDSDESGAPTGLTLAEMRELLAD